MRINVSLAGTYEYFTSLDDAWDSGAPDKKTGKPSRKQKRFEKMWLEAMDSGDYSAVPVKAGQTPVKWTLQYIGSRHRRFIQQQVDQFNSGRALEDYAVPWMAYYGAVRLGLVSVMGIFDGDDELVVERTRDPRLQDLCVDHDTMDKLSAIDDAAGTNVGEMIINELGLRIMAGGAPSPK